MNKYPHLLWAVALLFGACSSEPDTNPPPAPTPTEQTPTSEPQGDNPKTEKNESEVSAPSEPAPPTTPQEWEKMSPDERILETYRAIVCHMQKADQEGVKKVWKKYGYDDASWALEFQKATQRSNSDPTDFGKKWRAAKRSRCP